MPDQIRNIFHAFAQRRQSDRDDIQSEIEVLAKEALIDQVPEILVGCRNNANIRLDRRSSSDSGVLSLLQYPQEPCLSLHRHVANLVKEQRTTICLFETAGASVLSAGKCTFFVPEQFSFDQVPRNGSHIDGDKRSVATFCRSREARARQVPCPYPTRH